MDAVEASSAQVVDQCLVIVFRIVAAQRQFEAVFPLGRTMAGSGVAAGAAQDGLDVPNETHFGGSDAEDLDLQANALAGSGDRDGRFSCLAGEQITIAIHFKGGRLGLQTGHRAEIDPGTVGTFP